MLWPREGSTYEERLRADAQRIEDQWAPAWKGDEGDAARRVGVTYIAAFVVFQTILNEYIKTGKPADLNTAQLAARTGLREEVAAEALRRLLAGGIVRGAQSGLGPSLGWVPAVKAEADVRSIRAAKAAAEAAPKVPSRPAHSGVSYGAPATPIRAKPARENGVGRVNPDTMRRVKSDAEAAPVRRLKPGV